MDKFELVRFTDGDFELDIRTDSENETVWLSQKEISLLFETERSVVGKHISNILKSGEVREKSNVQKMHITHSDKPIVYIV